MSKRQLVRASNSRLQGEVITPTRTKLQLGKNTPVGKQQLCIFYFRQIHHHPVYHQSDFFLYETTRYELHSLEHPRLGFKEKLQKLIPLVLDFLRDYLC